MCAHAPSLADTPGLPDLFCRPCYIILYNQNIVSLPLVRKVPKNCLATTYLDSIKTEPFVHAVDDNTPPRSELNTRSAEKMEVPLEITASERFKTADISEAYVKFRPVYPQSVANIIVDYMKSKGSLAFDFAVDVGCGSGQSTFLLYDYFTKIVGLDISETQIQQAKLKSGEDKSTESEVKFIVGDAHNLPFESSSVDLITCAMAWHWLDAEKFYDEAKRVLKPGGCLAIYGHGVVVKDNERIKNTFDLFHDALIPTDSLGEENMHVLNNYEGVEIPFSQTQRIDFSVPQKSSIDQLLGFLSSVSAYRITYCTKFPENTLMQEIRAKYDTEDGKRDVEEYTFPGYAILGINE